MVREHGVNWDVVQIELAETPRPVVEGNPTDAEKLAAAKAFYAAVGPVEQFALACVAVRRTIPDVAVVELEQRIDAGEWVLDLRLGGTEAGEGGASDPLPPPATTVTGETS